jgi:paraquat-inducible protein B
MTTDPPVPKVSRAPAFPLIWAVPLVAILLGGWMCLRELMHRGPEITIDFSDASGVESGKTVLEYKGVSAGTVENVKLRAGLEGVSIELRLNRDAASLARAGSEFWIVHPEIGFSGVRGLDTIVTGVRINVLPGHGAPARRFTGLDKAPAPDVTDVGRTFILETDRLGSLTSGSPVLFREFKVGSVETSLLSRDSTAVLIRIHVDPPYADLVRTNTRFWNSGGFSFKMSLFGGAELKDTSLESLITGGVSFATPDDSPLAPPAPSGSRFKLSSEPDKDWLKWSPKIPVKPVESAPEPLPKKSILTDLMRSQGTGAR